MEKRYILCPRCELNYIEEGEEYCTVCKAELGLIDSSILIPEEEVESSEKLCPICKVNYIADDEDVCFMCAKEREKTKAQESPETEDNWTDEFEAAEADDEEPLSLECLSDEELEEDEEEQASAEPDDFDFSNVDPNDFEEDDDLDDEDDEEEDDE